jgi:hypothetical protein
MKYGTKEALLEDIRRSYDALVQRIEGIPSARYEERGVWSDAWSNTASHYRFALRVLKRWQRNQDTQSDVRSADP